MALVTEGSGSKFSSGLVFWCEFCLLGGFGLFSGPGNLEDLEKITFMSLQLAELCLLCLLLLALFLLLDYCAFSQLKLLETSERDVLISSCI